MIRKIDKSTQKRKASILVGVLLLDVWTNFDV